MDKQKVREVRQSIRTQVDQIDKIRTYMMANKDPNARFLSLAITQLETADLYLANATGDVLR